jgi:uncharacterized protein with HEPN domain
MTRVVTLRLQDLLEAIGDIRDLLGKHSLEELQRERMLRAALERYFEILSEASRYVPDDLRQKHGPAIPWRQIADLGNQIRHAYHRILPERLWAIYEDNLDELEATIQAILGDMMP